MEGVRGSYGGKGIEREITRSRGKGIGDVCVCVCVCV